MQKKWFEKLRTSMCAFLFVVYSCAGTEFLFGSPGHDELCALKNVVNHKMYVWIFCVAFDL